MNPVPEVRIRSENDAAVNPSRRYVLYWMTAFRRTRFNAALQRAVEYANTLGLPLVVLEALRVDYRWASDRHHRFVIEGMADNMGRLALAGVSYHPYVEDSPGAGKGLVRAMAEDAAVVVTDDWPCSFLPAAMAAAARQVSVLMESVDSNGLVPLHAPGRTFERAFSFRRWLHKNLDVVLDWCPDEAPLTSLVRRELVRIAEGVNSRWPATDLHDVDRLLSSLPIDHEVRPVDTHGGAIEGETTWRSFLARLGGYSERNHPDAPGASGLSFHLHFGHLSVHEIVRDMFEREDFNASRVHHDRLGSSTGFWGMSASAESFIDQVITWRELCFNGSARRRDFDQWTSLPEWARLTLERHDADPRPYLYDLDDLGDARTHDPVWNAAQTQLVREGRIHNYLRMLWGKRILEWSPTPRAALKSMIELNNRWAVDGRDPNSYGGIFWILGRYDRPWGPERPIFGKVRYMSSENTRRKLRLKKYLERYAPVEQHSR